MARQAIQIGAIKSPKGNLFKRSALAIVMYLSCRENSDSL